MRYHENASAFSPAPIVEGRVTINDRSPTVIEHRRDTRILLTLSHRTELSEEVVPSGITRGNHHLSTRYCIIVDPLSPDPNLQAGHTISCILGEIASFQRDNASLLVLSHWPRLPEVVILSAIARKTSLITAEIALPSESILSDPSVVVPIQIDTSVVYVASENNEITLVYSAKK